MRKVSPLCVIGILVAVAHLHLAFQVENPKLPEPYHTPSSNNAPRVIPRPEGANLTLPEGFQIEVYAEGFERPRFMLEGPSHEILLSDSSEAGSVYLLQDNDEDFKAESKQKILTGLDRPYGLAFWKDYLYVG